MSSTTKPTTTPDSLAKFREALVLQGQITDSVIDLTSLDAELARELVAKLAEMVGAANGHAPKSKGGREDSGTFDKVAAVFVGNGNKAMTKLQLWQAASITESALHTLIYTTRPKEFKRDKAKGVKGIILSLTPEALERARAKAESK